MPSKRWRISIIKSTPAALIGYVDAPDADSAIAKAIKQFKITDPQNQRQLIAQRLERGRPFRALSLREHATPFGRTKGLRLTDDNPGFPLAHLQMGHVSDLG
jgi:hypothetical protein